MAKEQIVDIARQYLVLLRKEGLDVDSRIEPYLISRKRFENDDTSPIIQMVKREGIEIAS